MTFVIVVFSKRKKYLCFSNNEAGFKPREGKYVLCYVESDALDQTAHLNIFQLAESSLNSKRSREQAALCDQPARRYKVSRVLRIADSISSVFS